MTVEDKKFIKFSHNKGINFGTIVYLISSSSRTGSEHSSLYKLCSTDNGCTLEQWDVCGALVSPFFRCLKR